MENESKKFLRVNLSLIEETSDRLKSSLNEFMEDKSYVAFKKEFCYNGMKYIGIWNDSIEYELKVPLEERKTSDGTYDLRSMADDKVMEVVKNMKHENGFIIVSEVDKKGINIIRTENRDGWSPSEYILLNNIDDIGIIVELSKQILNGNYKVKARK